MNRIILTGIGLFFCLFLNAQSPGVVVYTGLSSMYTSDRQVTTKGEMHYGWLVGADARLVEGGLYFLIGGQFIKSSLHSSKKPEFFKKRDFNVISGRLGLGFNLVRFNNGGTLRSKVLGSINFINDAPEGGLYIDGYRDLNNAYLGVLSGLGYTWGIWDIDFEYQYGIFNAFYKQPDTKFNGYTFTAGLHF